MAHVWEDNGQFRDQRALRWVLFCRAVALGLKEEEGQGPDAGAADDAEEGNNGTEGNEVMTSTSYVGRWAAQGQARGGQGKPE